MFNQRSVFLFGLVGMLFVSGCGGGSSSGGSSSGGSSSPPIAFYAYGDVYGASGANGNLVINAVNTSGIATSSTGPSTGIGPGQLLLVSISGTEYLYVENPDSGLNDTISIFKVAGSTVTSVGTTTTAANLAPKATMVYSNNTLYVPLQSGAIASYAVNSDGTLTFLQGAAYTVSGGAPLAMAVDATGKYLVVSEYASTTTWNALSLTIGTGGTLSLASSQNGISGSMSYVLADPSTTHGDYLYGSTPGAFYEISISGGGAITVTPDSSIVPNNNTTPTPAWIDPTGTWLFLAEYNGTTMAETLVQYNTNTNGSLTAGSMPQIQIATGSNGSVGGYTSSPGFYESANGMVVIPVGGYLTTYTFNSLSGYLTSLSLHTGDAPSGIMAAYAP